MSMRGKTMCPARFEGTHVGVGERRYPNARVGACVRNPSRRACLVGTRRDLAAYRNTGDYTSVIVGMMFRRRHPAGPFRTVPGSSRRAEYLNE